ncbi:hypothetical protein EDL79_00710 [Ehrlichia ruminantium]|uniref:Uncharacterized protein n=1 Tax=Ehrlichia ruminantium TaxID=779 RepID=A0AAE6Q8M6_EHRRU|nr:hypothetical protein [Ehrlichia ruminantium]QGR02215.1 hypothetical protein EDL81_00710 [Ehrlichia ruminantium]QGR03137.1 hypothetical protein EDL80_00710 [Ehrlichia ruminantium]QGR04062.1 hypothetical protein EDL79_00710 [Ehrlichia ruminantium]
MTDSFGNNTSLETGVNYRKVNDYSGLERDILSKAYDMKIQDFNLDVTVHTENVLSPMEAKKIENDIRNAAHNFKEHFFNINVDHQPGKVEVYLVNDENQYKQYSDRYGLSGDKNSKGITYIEQQAPYRLYLYKEKVSENGVEQDNVVGLKHELSYVFQDHISGHKLGEYTDRYLLAKFVRESIADFCEHHDSILHNMSVNKEVLNEFFNDSNLKSHEITDEITDVLEKRLDDYNTYDKYANVPLRNLGFVAVKLLSDLSPWVFEEYFSDIKNDQDRFVRLDLRHMNEPLGKVFEDWVKSDLKSLETEYKIQHNIPEDVTLQYVRDYDHADHEINNPKVHLVKYVHVGDSIAKFPAAIVNFDTQHSVAEESSVDGYRERIGPSKSDYDVPPDVITDKLSPLSTDNIVPIGNSQDFKDSVFNNVHDIKDNDLMLTLKVYTLKGLPNDRMHEIEKGFYDTIEKFKSNFGLDGNGKEATFELYLFDNRDQYEHYSKLYNLGIGGAGGVTFYGNENSPSRIYVYKFGDILNLKHELTHALENYASGYTLSRSQLHHDIFSEGLAEYIENDDSFILKGLKNKAKTLDVLNTNPDASHDVSSSDVMTKDIRLKYNVGHAFVTFLQEKHADVIPEYFKALKEHNFSHAQELVQVSSYSDFKDWLENKDISLYLQNMNVLQLGMSEKMFSQNNVNVFERHGLNHEYYYEHIYDMGGKEVGSISPIVHYAAKNTIRTWNIASSDIIEINPKYNFLKLVDSPLGKPAYVYADKDGNEYINSKNYIEYVFNILKKYDPTLGVQESNLELRGDYSKENVNRVFSKIPNADQLMDKYLDNAGANYKEFVLNNPSQFNIAKIYFIQDIFNNFKEEQVKKVLNGAPGVDNEIRKLIGELTYVDVRDVVPINNFDMNNIVSNPNIMLRVGVLGKGDVSGISLYLDDKKVGELSTEGGYCIKDLDTGSVDFVFRDVTKMTSSSYQDKAYMVVSENDGEFNTALINDIQKTKDGNIVWDNQFNHPSINHFHSGYKDLLLSDASFKDYGHISNTKFDAQDTVIKKGELLDDKGTVKVDDDVYQAKVTHDNQILHQFKSMSFYIDEPSTDSLGNYGSNFFITDEGKNIKFQLPKQITHLKLVQVDGHNKLVPCTADGNEHPSGMPPNLTDEYRYIDPIFAHTFEIQSYSNKSKSIGLIDFDQYKEGSLFKLQYYSDDYHIVKDEHGNAVKSPNVHYATKVDLVYDGKVIGMLSDNVNQFQGDIFIAASRNYSHSDFLSSKYFQKVDIHEIQPGIYYGQYHRDGAGDLGTDTGYSDHAVFYFTGNGSSVTQHGENVAHNSTIVPYHSDF